MMSKRKEMWEMRDKLFNAISLGLLIAISGFVVMTQAVGAEDFSSVEKAIIAKYKDFTSKVSDMYIKQNITAYLPTGKVASEIEMFIKGDKVRADTRVSMPKGIESQIGIKDTVTTAVYTPDKAWMIVPPLGKVEIPAEKRSSHQLHSSWWEEYTKDSKVVGQEVVDGVDCYLLEKTDRSSEFLYKKIWVDKENFVIVKSEHQEKSGIVFTTKASDIRPVYEDVYMPYRIDIYNGDKLFSEVIIKEIDINAGIPDSTFDADAIAGDLPSMGEMMQGMMQKKR